jgi:hypothetical protein
MSVKGAEEREGIEHGVVEKGELEQGLAEKEGLRVCDSWDWWIGDWWIGGLVDWGLVIGGLVGWWVGRLIDSLPNKHQIREVFEGIHLRWNK